MDIQVNKTKKLKWIGYGCLYGSIMFSFIFYVVAMAIGLRTNIVFSSSSRIVHVGLWDVNMLNGEEGTLDSVISTIGICLIIFFVIILGLLISGLIVHKKAKIHTNKSILISVFSSTILLLVTLILLLAAKPTSDFTSTNITYIFKVSDSSYKYLYTTSGLIITIFLSIAIVLPVTYTILGLLKIPYKTNTQTSTSVK